MPSFQNGVYIMKILYFSAAVLAASLAASSAFADNSHGPSTNDTRTPAVDYFMTASVGKAPSGYIVTYPTNADSILNVTPEERNQHIGH